MSVYTLLCEVQTLTKLQCRNVLRQAPILFGGAATIAHGELRRKTKDVDIIVSKEALSFLEDAIANRRGGFHKDCDEQ